MDTYIVRIYRRDCAEADNIVGVVEIVEANAKETFKNIVELMKIISKPEGKVSAKRKKQDRSKSEK